MSLYEYQINKDYDINNLYLDLTFQNQTEHFEYKKPLIDQISNYQLIVTKFHSKTSVPFIRLHDSKKNEDSSYYPHDQDPIKEGSLYKGGSRLYFYDYYIQIQYQIDALKFRFINQNLYKVIDSQKFLLEKDLKPIIFDVELENEENTKNARYVDHLEFGKERYWNFLPKENEIYSPSQLLNIINYSIQKSIERFLNLNFANLKSDYYSKYYSALKNKYKNRILMQYYIQNGRLKLKILDDFLTDINNNATTSDYDDPTGFTAGDGKEEKFNGYMRICFSRNLFKYLKSIHLSLQKEESNICYLEINRLTQKAASYEIIEQVEGIETKKLKYRIFEGEKINMIDWGDYVGVAVTSPDFPVKRQVYPHYFYLPGDIDNRRRYKTKSEENIKTISSMLTGSMNMKDNFLKNEDIKKYYKENMKEGIIFLKYFDRNDDINNINFELNNVETAMKFDLDQFIPLQEFTFQVWLIDRYNNFEPLTIEREELEDIVQMQILLRRLRGETEKENRLFIDVFRGTNVPTITDPAMIEQIYKQRKLEEKVMKRLQDIAIIKPDPLLEAEPVPEIRIPEYEQRFKQIKDESDDEEEEDEEENKQFFPPPPPPPPPSDEQQQQIETEMNPPPEKMIYIKPEPEEENENNNLY